MGDFDIQFSEAIDDVNLIDKSFRSFKYHDQYILLSNNVYNIRLYIEALYIQC